MLRFTDVPWKVAACAAWLIVAGSAAAVAQEVEADRLGSRPGWTKGPHTGDLGDQATVAVPEGSYFLDASATRAFLQATENVPSGRELGAIVRVLDEEHSWFALFSFSEDGYVDDSDKDKIDADALMKNMKAGTEQDNEERKKRGWAAFNLEGWHKAPYYDASTHNLTWAVRGSSPGESATINHSVRLLGRRGVMSVALVSGQDSIEAATRDFNQLLTGFDYKSGQRYAEFRSGDKLAGYGLAALIGGGAAAAAVKTGLFSKAWKAILFVFAAAIAGLKKLFGGRKEPEMVAEVQPPPVP